MILDLIRHGSTSGNLNRQYLGITNEELCDEGIRQLKERKTDWENPLVSRVYTSPMKRCVQTAHFLYPEIEVQTVDFFRETDFGDFEGKTYEELKNVSEYQAFLNSGGTIPFPNGESREQMIRRVQEGFCSVVGELSETGCFGAAIVAHGGTIMAILSQFAYPRQDFFSFQVENGAGYRTVFIPEIWEKKRRIIIEKKIG